MKEWKIFSINLTEEEYTKLEEMRGSIPRTTYIKNILFDNTTIVLKKALIEMNKAMSKQKYNKTIIMEGLQLLKK